MLLGPEGRPGPRLDKRDRSCPRSFIPAVHVLMRFQHEKLTSHFILLVKVITVLYCTLQSALHSASHPVWLGHCKQHLRLYFHGTFF